VDVARARVAVADGRVLDVLVAGPESGIPLVMHHGTPGAALQFEPFVETAVARGVRYVTYSRAGYGSSTRDAGRAVANCAADTARIADHLGLEQIYTLGWSGGGPHVLACAALLPERVVAAGTIAGVAPADAEGLDWTAGMGRENVEEFSLAFAGEEQLRPYLERQRTDLLAATGEDLARALGDLVSDVDKATLTGEWAELLAANFHEALRGGLSGWLDDDLAFVRDWGFELGDIEVPVTVWQGEQDRMVPFAHGEWLVAHIRGARPRLLAEHGHISLALDAFEMILEELVASRF
jgi:pimeloyl-ACP methyl ester carboxylesterase